MSDQTKPRVWNAGDPEPAGVARVRDSMGDVWTREPVLGGADVWMSAETHTMTWERIAKKYAPLTEVQTSSPVHGPSEDGNASEASSQPGVTAIIERVAQLYVEDIYGENPTCSVTEELEWGRDLARLLIDAELIGGAWPEGWVRHAEEAERRAASWWEAAKYLRRVTHRQLRLIDEANRRADAAEAELAETNRLLTAYQHDAVVWKRERDEARAKLAKVREVLADYRLDVDTRLDYISDIVDPEPTRRPEPGDIDYYPDDQNAREHAEGTDR